LFATAYAVTLISYYAITGKIFPYWIHWLLGIGVLYCVKDIYLETEALIPKAELEKYPSWVKNHAVYGLDGYVKIKRRILMES